MANNHGGPRTPSNPAPVSGPGQLSRRTDGGPASQSPAYISGGNYGDGQDLMDLQSSAPMAATPSNQAAAPRRVSAKANGASGVAATPLFAPTQRPDEPITAGAPFGPGPGPDAMPPGAGAPAESLTYSLAQLLPYDQSGEIAALFDLAQRKGW